MCSASTGAGVTTALKLGDVTMAVAWCQRLLEQQQAGGASPDATAAASPFHTGQVLRGMLALHDVSPSVTPDVAPALQAAAAYLADQIDRQGNGRLQAPAGSIDRWAPPSVHLSWLPPLLEAGRRFGEPRWEEAVWRCLHHQRRTMDLTRWNAPMHWWAYGVEALVDLGQRDLVEAALRLPAARQRRDGSVPALPRERWVSTAGLAHLAVIWYKLGSPGQRQQADRAMAALRRRQNRSGGFFGSWGGNARYFPRQEHAGAVTRFLDAAIWQVRSAFAGPCDFPAEINPGDGRLQAVLDWCGTLGPKPRIVDVGCGKGRFLRELRRRLPDAKLTGVDISANELSRLPEGVTARQGSLLRIPAAEGQFDGAISIEALEHSLLPQRAIAELCRVVRPGGAILIIDKDRRRQALSEHQPWERWFTGEEVGGWLRDHCDDVRFRPISHGEHQVPTGLFLCWTARRAADVASAAA